jgi:tetratricopeptide (TPR) repeat protein
MRFPRFPILFSVLAALCVALPSYAQRLDVAVPLGTMGPDMYRQLKGAMGVVLLSVNWNPKACPGFESAQLLGLSFDQVPTARGDEAPGDLVIDEPQAGIADYAFLAPPGAYALSGFDIKVVKSARGSGGFRAVRSRLLKDGFAVDGGFDVRVGEIVYIGDFSVECRRQPVPWRTYPDGPAEFQEYLGRIKSRFPALDTGRAQFRPMATKQFGPFYAPATVLKDAATRSIPELIRRAKGGDPDSQYRLGLAYDVGNDVPRDLAEAITWYRRAADAGNLEAQNNVGSALQAEKRYTEALAWYEKAAAQGHPRGISSLAALYNAGLGVKQDRAKAFELWARAAELGWAEAMWHLSNLYRVGALGERDLTTACAWNFRARGYARPLERGLMARADQATAYYEKTLHAGELAACRTLAGQWKPTVRRE